PSPGRRKRPRFHPPAGGCQKREGCAKAPAVRRGAERACSREPPSDRKSTRLNSSHVKISYAVFCLKKKKLSVRGPADGGGQGLAGLVGQPGLVGELVLQVAERAGFYGAGGHR